MKDVRKSRNKEQQERDLKFIDEWMKGRGFLKSSTIGFLLAQDEENYPGVHSEQLIAYAMMAAMEFARQEYVVLDNCVPKLHETNEFKQYRRKNIAEMRPYVKDEILDSKVSISEADLKAGSPKLGDMIARNPKNHNDQWLVAKAYFENNFKLIA